MDVKEYKFVELIIPLFIDRTFTYAVPFDLQSLVKPGQRVIVQFGQKKFYTAIIFSVTNNIKEGIEPKQIDMLLDDKPILSNLHLKFWKWISDYYMSSMGDVMKTALPSALRIESETTLEYNSSLKDFDFNNLNQQEFIIAKALQDKDSLNISDIQKILGSKKVQHLVKNLISKGIAVCVEEIAEKYKPKIETWVRLNDELASNSEKLDELVNALSKKAPKQSDVLLLFLHETLFNEEIIGVNKSVLAKRCSSPALQSLIKKEVLVEFEKIVSRLDFEEDKNKREFELSEAQSEALKEIKANFIEKDIVLLHGITSSGKTEIYIRLIEEQLANNKQVLFLLPEIALTTQIIQRLKLVFGNKVGVFHHKFNFNEKIELWKSVSEDNNNDENKYQIIIGTRSAVFLPFNNLGLVIVDEEHDSSYKQNDKAPRYNGRDTAIMLAYFHKAKVLLGTATPSIETYYNTTIGRYGLVELFTRFGDLPLPKVELVNMTTESKSRKGAYYLSFSLKKEIQNSLDNKEQIILFQNRRGFVPIVECTQCAWVPQCKNCDVSLTYHKHIDHLKCHLCGFLDKIPEICPVCGNIHIKFSGFGTEKVEEEVKLMFPTAKVARLDTDSTRGKYSHQNIISAFENEDIDILVGTQMVTKGLDFNNVGLVGILNADSLLSFPDFRSFERGFQLITQIMGRAGRKKSNGKVILQTRQIDHEIIKLALKSDFDSFFNSQIAERKSFKYPPFYRLVQLSIMHKDPRLVSKASNELKSILDRVEDLVILGPEEPYYGRVKTFYIRNILIKIPRTTDAAVNRNKIRHLVNNYVEKSPIRGLRVFADADPV